MEHHKEKDNEKKEHRNNSQAFDKKEPKMILVDEAEYLGLKEELVKAKESWDKAIRLQADLENIRRRTEKEKQEFVKFANENIILELLNVLDDLERTVELAQTKHQDLSAFLKGVEMILAHLYELLKKYDVRPIEAKGKIFDPNFHEALMQVENNELLDHTVIDEMQKGYFLNDRVIRTAKVSVSKKTENKQKEEKK